MKVTHGHMTLLQSQLPCTLYSSMWSILKKYQWDLEKKVYSLCLSKMLIILLLKSLRTHMCILFICDSMSRQLCFVCACVVRGTTAVSSLPRSEENDHYCALSHSYIVETESLIELWSRWPPTRPRHFLVSHWWCYMPLYNHLVLLDESQ